MPSRFSAMTSYKIPRLPYQGKDQGIYIGSRSWQCPTQADVNTKVTKLKSSLCNCAVQSSYLGNLCSQVEYIADLNHASLYDYDILEIECHAASTMLGCSSDGALLARTRCQMLLFTQGNMGCARVDLNSTRGEPELKMETSACHVETRTRP